MALWPSVIEPAERLPTPHDSGYKPLFSDPLMVRGLVQGFIDDQLGVSFVMGVGGTFDVVAGKVQRAFGWGAMTVHRLSTPIAPQTCPIV